VVADRALRNAELAGQLLRRPGTLAQQGRDSRAELVRERTQLLSLGDDERLVGFVVERRLLNDYGRDFPTILEIPPVWKAITLRSWSRS
jgi:hypothetical protein